MATDLAAIGADLHVALTRRFERRRRTRRRLVTMAVATLVVCGVAATAIASGIGPDLQLDPTQWSIVGGGSVDNGRGAYVHAKRLSDGSPSTFLVEHDAGLPAYHAFLLHERTLAAAQASSPVPVQVEPGDLCTPFALTRAEAVALSTLRTQFSSRTNADATKASVDSAVQAAFAGSPCRGLEYASEQARRVYAGVQPGSTLMPSVQ